MAENNDKGQSTIEFIMTFTAAVGFIFLFLKMSMNFTDGYMVHHATYMAARAYLVDDQDRDAVEEGDQRAFEKARDVFTRYLPADFVSGVSSGALQENNPNPVNTKYQAFVGLWIEFTQKFTLGFIGGTESMTMRSEAFLGREPSRAEAKKQSCNAIKDLGLSRCDVHVTLDDNGG